MYEMLQEAERRAGVWPTGMPGHVDFGAEGLDVDGTLPDGVHRLDGSSWQFVVENGHIVRGVREDLSAWWAPKFEVHPQEPGIAPA